MDEVEPGVFETELLGKQLRYTRREGFSTVDGTINLPYSS